MTDFHSVTPLQCTKGHIHMYTIVCMFLEFCVIMLLCVVSQCECRVLLEVDNNELKRSKQQADSLLESKGSKCFC